VNCTAASISSRSHSLNGRRSESICGRGSAALSSVSEECAGVVKTATFDADQLVVKARLGPSAQWKKHIIVTQRLAPTRG